MFKTGYMTAPAPTFAKSLNICNQYAARPFKKLFMWGDTLGKQEIKISAENIHKTI